MLLGTRASRRTNAACLEGIIFQTGSDELSSPPFQHYLLGSGQQYISCGHSMHKVLNAHRDLREVVLHFDRRSPCGTLHPASSNANHMPAEAVPWTR